MSSMREQMGVIGNAQGAGIMQQKVRMNQLRHAMNRSGPLP